MSLIRLALRPWRLTPWSQAFSAVAMAFLLTLGAFLLRFEFQLRPTVQKLSRDQVLTAFIEPSSPAGEESRIADQIRVSLGSKDIEIRGVGEKGFLEALRPNYPGLANEIESLGDEGRDLIPRHVLVAGVLPADAEARVKATTGIVSIDSTRNRYQQSLAAFQAVLRISRWMFAGLALALLCGLFQLGRLNAQMHAESLQLMRLWGAHPVFLRIPPMLSGLSVGAAGGLLGWVIWSFGFPGLFDQLAKLSIVFQGMDFARAQAMGPMIAVAGILAGAATGLAAVLRKAG